MALELLERPAPAGGPCRSEIHLVMGSPYTTDLLYDDLFRRLASEHPNFHYHVAISRETRPDGRRGLYAHQLIEEQLERFGPLLAGPRTVIYICGLLGMQEGLFKALARHGLAEGYLRVGDELAGIRSDSRTGEQVRRHVRETGRCMVEVY
jgi:ferredoxin--NADP+ reductase